MPRQIAKTSDRIRWDLVILSFFAGILFICLDLPREGASVTPLLSICWLLAMSMRADPGTMIRVIAVLFLFVIASMVGQELDRTIIRGLSFLTGGIIAVLHSASSLRNRRLSDQLRLIVEMAPAGLVTASPMGCIISASNDIRQLLGAESEWMEGHSFSDIFMSHLPPGEAMHRYIEWFRRDDEHEEMFVLRRRPDLKFRARVICSGTGSERILIASLRNLEQHDLPRP